MREPLDARHRRVALLALAVINDVPRFGFVGEPERGRPHPALPATSTSTGVEGGASLTTRPAIVKHRADFAENRPADEEVAGVQRAILYQNRSHRAAPLIHARFEHCARPRARRIGLEFPQSATSKIVSSSFSMPCFFFAGNFHELRVAAPFRRHQAGFRELPLSCAPVCASGLSIC